MINNILKRIAVHQPYFALKNLKIEANETLSAELPKEQPMGNECGAISAAEAGRHLAILGSCALALRNPNPDRHYFLAVGAKVTKVSNWFDSLPLFGKANVVSQDKRNGIVSTKLFTENGRLLYFVEVTYKIMHYNLFEKLFSQNKWTSPIVPSFNNPYINEIPFAKHIFEPNKFKTSLGPLQPNQCIGHFQNFPAVPVAILMHSLSRAAGILFSHKLAEKNLSYTVEKGFIKANNLAFAGNKISIEVSYLENSDYNFRCLALSDKGIEYGTMDLLLKPLISNNIQIKKKSLNTLQTNITQV